MLGYTALEFGLGTAVMTVMAVVGAAGGQTIVTRLGFRSMAVVDLALTGGPDRLSALTEGSRRRSSACAWAHASRSVPDRKERRHLLEAGAPASTALTPELAEAHERC